MVGLVVIVVLIVFSVLAVGYGVDSRDGFPDPRRPMEPTSLR